MTNEVAELHEEHVAPAEAWEDRDVAPGGADLANAAVALAGLTAGESFLDVAGTGGLRLPAARRGANVFATDWTVSDVGGRVLNHSLDLDDDTFDITGSQFGAAVVPDQLLALHEMARVTKPGGRVLLIAYASPARFEALQYFIGALLAVVRDLEGLPDEPPPPEFEMADPEVLRQRLVDAGFRDVTVDTSYAECVELTSGKQLWDWCLHRNPTPGMLVAELTDEQQTTVRDVLDRMLRERSNGNEPTLFTNAVNIGIGTK